MGGVGIRCESAVPHPEFSRYRLLDDDDIHRNIHHPQLRVAAAVQLVPP